MKHPDISGFKILSVIGSGGMGTVYRTLWLKEDSEVALKVLHPHLAHIEQFTKRFHKEAALAEKLAHPKVARVLTSGEEDGFHYIAMEYVRGEKLTDYLKRGASEVPIDTLDIAGGDPDATILLSRQIAPEKVILLMRQMAAVLEEARQLGLVHRDIKPDNIIIDEDWNIKLLDFGIAKDRKSLDSVITLTGQTFGTPPYMSPEQCRASRDIDTRSDLYSLGVVAYQCLCGHTPFGGPSTTAYLNQHINETPHPLHEIKPTVPRNLSYVIDRLLAKDPTDRHQNPSELIEDLNRVERGEKPLRIYHPKKRHASVLKYVAPFAVIAAVIIAILVLSPYSPIGKKEPQSRSPVLQNKGETDTTQKPIPATEAEQTKAESERKIEERQIEVEAERARIEQEKADQQRRIAETAYLKGKEFEKREEWLLALSRYKEAIPNLAVELKTDAERRITRCQKKRDLASQYEQAQNHLKKGEYTKTLELAEEIIAEKGATYKDVANLKETAQAQLELKKLLGQAQSALNNKDFKKADELVKIALKLETEDATAKALAKQISQETEKERQQNEIITLLTLAETAFKKKDFAKTEELVNEALKLEPENAKAKRLRENLSSLTEHPWQMFRANASHTGQSKYNGPDKPHKNWTSSIASYRARGFCISSPAIGKDGTIYIGSIDNKLYAINPDGSKNWHFITGDRVKSSPAIGKDGIIYVGSADNKLYAINPDGSKKWAFATGDDIFSSPAIGADRTIYVGSFDKKLYAINPDGSKKWAFTTGGSIWSSPAISTNGTIYLGSDDKKLYAINPDGTKKWAFATESGVRSSPAIGADKTIYFGSLDEKLYAVNPDGTIKWKFVTGGDVGSSPAIGTDRTIYVGSGDGKLYAVNPDGSKKWEFRTGKDVGAAPAIGADGTIYVGSADNKLYAITPDGRKNWAVATGGEVTSSPAIGADGTVYVGSYDKKLYAIGKKPRFEKSR